MPIKYLRISKVIERTGLSRSTIYYWIKRGEFPAPVHLGQRTVAWLESEVNLWMEQRLEARDEQSAA